MNLINQKHKYHYNYKIINSKTNQFYIGVRSCDCEIKDDVYMGSSTVWTKEYIMANKNVLIKEIIAIFKTRREAVYNEAVLLKKYEDDELCINQYYGIMPDVTGRKQTTEHIEKRKRCGEKNGFYGKHHTEEQKQKISEKLKGRKQSDETKRKIGDWHRNKTVSKETREKLHNLRSFKLEITDLETNKTWITTSVDFCEEHKEYNITPSGINYAARNSGKYKKRFIVKRLMCGFDQQ